MTLPFLLPGSMIRASLLLIFTYSFASFCSASENSKSMNMQNPPQVRSWGYQLQNYEKSPPWIWKTDVLVLDPNADQGEGGKFSPSHWKRLKERKEGVNLLFAYLSIGEAEDYRGYFASLKKDHAHILAEENPDWPGNFKVRYWEEAWQTIILHRVSEIVEEGYDGLYLDIVDAWWYFKEEYEHSKSAMIRFVQRISKEAKQLSKKEFYIIPQNAGFLVNNYSYLSAIDGIGRESVFFGEQGLSKENTDERIKQSLEELEILFSHNKMVMMVEYDLDKESALKYCEYQKKLPRAMHLIAHRALDRYRLGNCKPGKP